MEVSVRKEEDIYVVTVLASRIDAACALECKETMRRSTDGSPPQVVLDLSEVTFIDSSGLGAIVATMKLLAPERRLALAGMSPAVDKVFKLTRMDRVFRIFPTLDEALCGVRV